MNCKKYGKVGCIILALCFAFMAGRKSMISIPEEDINVEEGGDEKIEEQKSIISIPEENINVEEDSDGKLICGRYEYEIIAQDGTVRILTYLGDESIIFIPTELDGRKISVIGKNAFSRNATVEQVIFPSGITEIEREAFAYCSRLETVILGQELEKIGGRAFAYCPSLTEIRFPEGLKETGGGICAYCPKLEKIYIPESMESIGDKAFEGCSNLKLVYGSSTYAEIYAQQEGLVYVDVNRIEEEGNLVW
ncbi:MAG: leucine-rich repeat domain-containing protein [Lachnospiraceae bacterium]|nr:leucine-rich repeat domain-containing protein [Lachnospiraceae bacterium]